MFGRLPFTLRTIPTCSAESVKVMGVPFMEIGEIVLAYVTESSADLGQRANNLVFSKLELLCTSHSTPKLREGESGGRRYC